MTIWRIAAAAFKTACRILRALVLTVLFLGGAAAMLGSFIYDYVVELLNYNRYKNVISVMAEENQGKTQLLGAINAIIDSAEREGKIYRVKTKCRDSHGHTEEWIVEAEKLDDDMWAAVKEKRAHTFYV